MALICSAIVGVICVAAPIGGTTDIKINDQGIYVHNSAEAGKWKADWGRSMEYPAPRIDSSRLDKACVKDLCLGYWRRCDDAVHPTHCTFLFEPRPGMAESIVVEGADEAAFKQAMESVGVVVGWQPVTAVPLAKMDREGKGLSQPVCAGNGFTDPPASCHVPMD